MFLAFDSVKKTATFQLAAGNELDNQISLNGAQRGQRTLTVPVGWRVGIEFTNRDAELPHSATIVAGFESIPEQLPPPAFPNAHTDKVDEGLLEGDSDVISFVADRAGRYLIACGVLGHAQRGQWIVLQVSPTATVPTYR
jgi:FtsP/CotA-like multicopper oxidase with cupredoxin domain